MKKLAVLSILLALLSRAANAEEDRRTATQEPSSPNYESPILSLLLLPVNVLIKMASVLGPNDSTNAGHDRAPADRPSR